MSAYSVSDGYAMLTVTTDPGTHRIRLDIDLDGTAAAGMSLSRQQAADLATALDLRRTGGGHE